MEKKEITAKTTVKAIITGFVSYGIITIFICYIILTIANSILNNYSGTSSGGLYITLPMIAVIFVYCIIHLVCRMSTYDVFKKCKTNPDNYKKISKFLNIFFIVVILASIILFLGLLNMNLKYQLMTINYSTLKYKEIFSENFVETLHNQMISTYNTYRTNLITATIILEIGCAISFLSLIPYQSKMIKKYNEF